MVKLLRNINHIEYIDLNMELYFEQNPLPNFFHMDLNKNDLRFSRIYWVDNFVDKDNNNEAFNSFLEYYYVTNSKISQKN